jgi:serine/threonine protein kinase
MALLKDQYEIISDLGEGGCGQTFIAIDTHLPSKAKCVIKKIHPESTTTPEIHQLIRERFNCEARVLEDLGNECDQIPTLYAYFPFNGEYYLVQEYIEGVTLEKRVLLGGPVTEEEVRNFLDSFLEILIKVHSKKIIHRDIKPPNIILRSKDGKPVLIDFGIVKEVVTLTIDKQGHPMNTIRAGTPGFMPFEQAAGRPVFASDLYSLGITAIFYLTGKMPKDDPTNGQIQWRSLAPNLSSGLTSLINKAIHSDIRKRYKNSKEMLDALRKLPPVRNSQNGKKELITDGKIPTELKPTVLQSEKFFKRNRLRNITILIIIFLFGISGGFLWRFYQSMKNPLLYFDRGVLLYNEGKLDLAIDDFNMAIKLNPANPHSYLKRGEAYNKKGNFDLAVYDFNQVIIMQPDSSEAYCGRGIAYSNQNIYDLAITDFSNAIKMKPDVSNYYYYRGDVYLKRENLDSALVDFTIATKLSARFAEAFYGRGIVYNKKREMKLAIEDFTQVITLQPDNALAYYNRGLAYKNITKQSMKVPSAQSNLDYALEDFNKSIILNPNYADSYYYRGEVYIGKRDYDLAIIDFSKVINLRPDFISAYKNRGNLYLDKKSFETAIQDFSDVIKLQPTDLDAYAKRATAYDKTGMFNLAINDLSEIIKQQPNASNNYRTRAYLYQKIGDSKLAIADFNQYINLNLEDANAYLERARFFNEIGLLEQAISDYKKALALATDEYGIDFRETIREELKNINSK